MVHGLNLTSLRLKNAAEINELDRQALALECRLLELVWPFLSADEISELIEEGTVSELIESNNNLKALGKVYTGTIEARMVYVHTLTYTILGEATPWRKSTPKAAVVKSTLEFGVSQSEEAQQMLFLVNRGNMPVLLNPDPER